MKMGYIQAELLRRQWITWAKENLPSFSDLSGDEGKRQLAEANETRPPYGAARCYEREEVTYEAFAGALVDSLQSIGMQKLVVVIGDPLSVAMFEIDVTDLTMLLRRAATDYSVVTLIPQSLKGKIVVDVPTLSDEQQEMLISTTGECESLIDEIKIALPGGDEFRGN
jgi:hypothetical protein